MTDTNAARRFDPVKAMEVVTAIVFSIILAVCIIGFVPISYPAVTRKVIELTRLAGIDSCTIGSVRVVLWRGITVRDVRGTGALDTIGRRYAVKAGTLVLRASFIHVALNYKEFERRARSAAAFKNEPSKAFRILCRSAAGVTDEVTASATEVTVFTGKGPLLQGHDCSLAIAFTKNGQGDFDGSFSAAALTTANITAVRRLSGDLTCRGDTVSLSQCSGRCFGGKMQCDARFYFVRHALAGLTFSIKGLDFDEWYKQAAATAGRLSGKADCRLALDSSALAVDSLRGRGTLAAAHCTVSGFSFQQTLAGMFGYPALTHLRFRKFTADCTIKPQGVITTEASGEGDSLSVRMWGWIGINGQLNEKAECIVPRIAVPTLSQFVRETLEETGDGGRVLRLRIFGDVHNPKFEIDSRVILQKAVKNMFEGLRDNLKQWLK